LAWRPSTRERLSCRFRGPGRALASTPLIAMSESAPTDQEFLVELPVFSGPFRLLAELILDQRVDVCDVPVALHTESFLRRGGGGVNSRPPGGAAGVA